MPFGLAHGGEVLGVDPDIRPSWDPFVKPDTGCGCVGGLRCQEIFTGVSSL